MASFRAAPVRVRVPASSANLGPGFDTAGLALALHDDIVVQVVDSGTTIDVAGEGAADVRRDARNLVVKAMRSAFDVMGGQPRGLHVVCANRIPHGRGLGSSAAAIVAGITAARALVVGEALDDLAALRLASAIEGHPDNVAACQLGGLTFAWSDADGIRATRLPLAPGLQVVAFVPRSKQSTKVARALIPATVSHADAAKGAGRAALLAAALGGRVDLLLAATEDWLHQPYRLPAQPRSAELLSGLRGAGIAAVLSGSGPTVLALVTGADQVAAAALHAGRSHEAVPLEMDTDGARLVSLTG